MTMSWAATQRSSMRRVDLHRRPCAGRSPAPRAAPGRRGDVGVQRQIDDRQRGVAPGRRRDGRRVQHRPPWSAAGHHQIDLGERDPAPVACRRPARPGGLGEALGPAARRVAPADRCSRGPRSCGRTTRAYAPVPMTSARAPADRPQRTRRCPGRRRPPTGRPRRARCRSATCLAVRAALWKSVCRIAADAVPAVWASGERPADLTGDLRLADHHRVQAGGDGEQVRGDRGADPHLEQRADLGRGAAPVALADAVGDRVDRVVEALGVQVDLQPVAGGQHAPRRRPANPASRGQLADSPAEQRRRRPRAGPTRSARGRGGWHREP